MFNNSTSVSALVFAKHELTIINVLPPDRWDADLYVDTWANTLVGYACNNRELVFCTDFDGTTDGNSKGVSILIPSNDLEVWQAAAKELNCDLEESAIEVSAGVFGDSQYTITLAETEDNFYWIE